MKINQCSFVISAVSPRQYPADAKPEIALAGRSNVGKSSLTNMLINRKGLAKTSSTPGKTQTINFYDIGNEFRFVDLPGYGYAKVSKSQRGTWGKIIETYLNQRPNLLEVFLLVDLRHKPSEDDVLMFEWIKSCGFRGIVVATKLDKIKKSQLRAQQNLIKETLGMTGDDILFCASAETRDGKYKLWDFMNSLFESRGLDIYFERQVGELYPEKAKAIRERAAEARAKALAEGFEAAALEPLNRQGYDYDEDQDDNGYGTSYGNESEDEMEDEAFESEMEKYESGMSARAMISSQLRIPKKSEAVSKSKK